MIPLHRAKSLYSLTLLILLGMIWGTGYSIARFAMTHEVPPLGYSFWQALGPAIIMGCLSLSRLSSFSFPSRSSIHYYLICALLGIVIPNTSMYFAAPHLPAGILAMIVNIVPILAYPLALMAKLESFQWQRMLGIALAFCGLMLIIIPKSSLPTPEATPWVLSTLITPLSFALCSIYIARYRPAGSDSLSLTTGMLVFATLLLIPLVIINHSFYVPHFPFTQPDWVILLEIILSSIGYLLFFQLIKIAGPVYYSLVDTMVVLTGLFWGYVIFAEQLNRWTALALCFILIALILVTRQQRAQANQRQQALATADSQC